MWFKRKEKPQERQFECVKCGRSIMIFLEKTDIDIDCPECNHKNLIRYENKKYIQKGYDPEIITCAKCRKDIVINHSIRPIKMKCKHCKTGLKIYPSVEEDESENILICPGCQEKMKLPSKKGVVAKCKNCGAKIKIR